MVTAARVFVFGCGLVAFAFWVRQWIVARRGRSESGRVVNPSWRTGSLVQVLSAVYLFIWPRPHPMSLPVWLYAVACALALASTCFGIVAGLHLGKQMRVMAVVTAEHRLITTGPYSFVRHPIYTAAFGIFAAAALVFCHPMALAVAAPVFLVGTELRTRAEDELLARHFGAQFQEYRRRVSAYLPGVR